MKKLTEMSINWSAEFWYNQYSEQRVQLYLKVFVNILANLPEMTEEKEIHDFMAKHVTSDLQMKVDISVKDLRRIIPIMIMHIFNIREERTQKKGKHY